MPSPFRGMDPYLERKGLHSEVQFGLIMGIRRELVKQSPPNYRPAIKEMIYNVKLGEIEPIDEPLASQDCTDTRRHIEIQEIGEVKDFDNWKTVSVVEVTSHATKTSVSGKAQFETRRNEICNSGKTVVVIDLLRDAQDQYNIYIFEPYQRGLHTVTFGLQEPIPKVTIPVEAWATSPVIDIAELLNAAYDECAYDLAIDYKTSPSPPLSYANTAWARSLIAEYEARLAQ